MKHFIEGPRIWWDTETTGINLWKGDAPFAFSFANDEGDTAYFEFQVDPFTRKPVLDRQAQASLEKIKRLLEDPTIVKGGHNMKFDVRAVERAYGIRVAGPGGPVAEGGRLDETMFMAHCCNTLEFSYALKSLSKQYADISDEDEKELGKVVKHLRLVLSKKHNWKIAWKYTPQPDGSVKKESAWPADYWVPFTAFKRLGTEYVSEEQATMCHRYCTLDSLRCVALATLYESMMDELGTRDTYARDIQLWPVVYRMESRGVRLSPEGNRADIEDCKRRIELHRRNVSRAAEKPDFKISADAQVRWLLFEKLQLPINPNRVTEKKGLPSVDADALRELMPAHPIVQDILKYKAAWKSHGYFATYLQLAVEEATFLVLHPDFRQVLAATRRFSCSNPNIQQVTSIESSRSVDPVDARGSYGPRPGYAWLHCDYKGMEVRVYADCAQEPKMLATLAAGREIHDEVTNRGWGGEGNPAGLYECVNILGLNGSEHGKDAQEWWNKWSLSSQKVVRLSEEEKEFLAHTFLKAFKFDIVKAQASLGKKVTKNKAKMVFFAKIYGGGARAVMELLRIERHEAQAFLDYYDEIYPGMAEYKYALEAQAREHGYIRNRWNARLCVRPDKLYQAVNYMVQGSSADLLKSAMVKCSNFFRKEKIDAHIVMTIHDELVFEVNKRELTYPLVRKVCSLMEDTDGHIGIPMPTEPSVAWEKWSVKDKLKI